MICPKLEKKGVASIPVVLGLMVLLISVGLFITSISLSDSLSTNNLGISNQALSYARAGAHDALERVVRNSNYATSSITEMITGGCSGSYRGCVVVSVSASSSPKVIISDAQIGDIKRSVRVDANLDSNGIITTYSWQE